MPHLSAPLILASGSPRRKDLLEEAGYEIVVIPPEEEEVDDPSIPIGELTQMNAMLKADCVAVDYAEAIVIAADTLVLRDGVALGKPADMKEAGSMIRSLNGRAHQVFTAVCVLQNATGFVEEFTVITDVQFKQLTDAELDNYHKLIEPLDKAGAYAAQDHGELIIESIVGSQTNVVGLPMDEVNTVLERFTKQQG
ncbi:UNVERIFIED_CONTAM: hypothetical protein GTU68_059828 [Idotea baltica]|nr:hypothetical protein [Idotea baltica]